MSKECPDCGTKLEADSVYFCPNDYTRYYVCTNCEREVEIVETYDEPTEI